MFFHPQQIMAKNTLPDCRFSWFCEPKYCLKHLPSSFFERKLIFQREWSMVDGPTNSDPWAGLQIKPDCNTDFWQRTHYGFTHDNGHFFFSVIPPHPRVEYRTRVQWNPCQLYDQAGIMVRVNEDNWIKTCVRSIISFFNLLRLKRELLMVLNPHISALWLQLMGSLIGLPKNFQKTNTISCFVFEF